MCPAPRGSAACALTAALCCSDSPHSEPGAIDEGDHDNGTEPHTSDDGEQQAAGPVSEELCPQGSSVQVAPQGWGCLLGAECCVWVGTVGCPCSFSVSLGGRTQDGCLELFCKIPLSPGRTSPSISLPPVSVQGQVGAVAVCALGALLGKQ